MDPSLKKNIKSDDESPQRLYCNKVKIESLVEGVSDLSKSNSDDFEMFKNLRENSPITHDPPNVQNRSKTYCGKPPTKPRNHTSLDSLFNIFDGESIYNHYSKILPIAKRHMETRLCELADKYNSEYIRKLDICPSEKFAANQIVKIARSVCFKSLAGDPNLNRKYLADLIIRIENLLREENNPNNLDMTAETIELKNAEQDLKTYLRQNLGISKELSSERNSKKTVVITRGQRLVSISVKPDTKNLLNRNESVKSTGKESSIPKESDFRIIKLISQGAFSAVYLVRYAASGRRFAMKKIHKSHALLKNQVRQIFAERDILSFTDNPFVISMFCSFETLNSYCMVMEYAEGGDCASLLRSIGILPLELARTYIAETFVAVEYIHNYGIIHRDIKPDNLLITSMGHIKLTDFGLSKIGLMNLATINSKDFVDTFHDKKIQGTPNYVAPEVILNKPYGRAVDFWSIGIVLYEFLVGCTPFYGDTVDDIFESIVYAQIEWPEGDDAVHPDAFNIIMKLLNRNPQKRAGYDDTESIRSHPFFIEVKWDDLFQTKAQFLPHSSNEEDTSNFDNRIDRYQNYTLFDADGSFSNSDSSFDSYTKLFKEVAIIENSNIEQSKSKDNETSRKSIYEDSSNKSLNHQPFHLTIHKLNKTSISGNFGFVFRTTRVICSKKLSFLIHIIGKVRSNSNAELSGLKEKDVILFIENDFVVGKQHVEVVRLLYGIRSLQMKVTDMKSLGITKNQDSNGYLFLSFESEFFKFLVHNDTTFEKFHNSQFIPVKVDLEGKILHSISSSSSESFRIKRDKPNFFKKFIKRKKKEYFISSSPKTLESSKNIEHSTLLSCPQNNNLKIQKKLSLNYSLQSSPFLIASSKKPLSTSISIPQELDKKGLTGSGYRKVFNDILKDITKIKK